MSYNVARRTGEVAIRMALGAQASDVARAVLREALVLVSVGILIGLPAAVAVTRLVQNHLYGVQPIDPVTFASVTAMLAVVALAAAWMPARRAARVDPMVALRSE
jgi:ABC-type antimicrobial peptide transport system permease subunit